MQIRPTEVHATMTLTNTVQLTFTRSDTLTFSKEVSPKYCSSDAAENHVSVGLKYRRTDVTSKLTRGPDLRNIGI